MVELTDISDEGNDGSACRESLNANIVSETSHGNILLENVMPIFKPLGITTKTGRTIKSTRYPENFVYY